MIRLDGVTFDLVVQREEVGGGWMIADSDGVVMRRGFATRDAAAQAKDAMEAGLVATGGRRVAA